MRALRRRADRARPRLRRGARARGADRGRARLRIRPLVPPRFRASGSRPMRYELFTAVEPSSTPSTFRSGSAPAFAALIAARDLLGLQDQDRRSGRANAPMPIGSRSQPAASCRPTRRMTFADGMAVRVPDATALEIIRGGRRADRRGLRRRDRRSDPRSSTAPPIRCAEGAGAAPLRGADEGARPAAGPPRRRDRDRPEHRSVIDADRPGRRYAKRRVSSQNNLRPSAPRRRTTKPVLRPTTPRHFSARWFPRRPDFG